jgi:NAD(P)-dependent dehydrogenase (short-subunit alcohol dehydrogenase family)
VQRNAFDCVTWEPPTFEIIRSQDVMSVPLEVWWQTIDVTLTGYMYGIRHALPLLIERGGGAIGLTRHAATLGGNHGVRCNLVAPEVVLTKTALKATSEEFRKEILASVRSPRLGVPEDIAAMVAFLFSDDGAYVNGQTILVDGGAHLT